MKILDFNKFHSLVELVTYFKSDQDCVDVLVQSRWGEYVVCPYCGFHHCKKGYRGRFVCPYCKNKFSATVGTIFENSKIGLRKWFIAMYLISSHKKGISSNQLAKDIKVTQKTAWYMLHKIRTLFYQDDEQVLEGDIEIDEVYIGGREYLKHKSKKVEGTQGRSTKTKTPIFGLLVRGKTSQVYALKVLKTDRYTLLPLIRSMCKPGSRLYTDESASYFPLSGMGYDHKVVNHKVSQYVSGRIYTNSIEGFWGHLKRMILGIYHKVSKEHIQSYIDESVWRWNNRNKSEGQRFSDMFGRSLHRVTYAMIIT